MTSRALSLLTATPRRQAGFLACAAGVVLVAFFLAPNALARSSIDTGNVGDAFREGFVSHWASGGRDLPARLDAAVAFWFRFHLVKAGVSALLLAVAVALAVVLGRRYRQLSGGRNRGRTGRVPGALALPRALVLAGVLALFALVALVANLQGAVAPFSSLLPFLTSGGGHGELGATLDEVRQQLAALPAGERSPALAFMVGDFAAYHAVLAVMAALVAVASAGAAAVLFRRLRASRDVRSRRARTCGAAATAVLAAAALVIAVANTTSAADSPRALALFFAGDW
ncbi:tat (twin-arginine translocation) pathway signal sequence [Streptomyces ficellus]|uniref:Tat (Twin-arginine translocation) pathway signal sequence n=1 Tax=Streptomyces ficellus TaxID=1977088 RepID=A0A6I6FGT4_9ACTN|nr:tat (twin-arginine translocation) pathway signal sequence [Streptomyces ficellus]QGV82331.1 tat (twin-arginine translocation) pathway signal sequence [Streptomyces ficellus]